MYSHYLKRYTKTVLYTESNRAENRKVKSGYDRCECYNRWQQQNVTLGLYSNTPP